MRGRTSSIAISEMSHFERTTIVESCALRATSATERALKKFPQLAPLERRDSPMAQANMPAVRRLSNVDSPSPFALDDVIALADGVPRATNVEYYAAPVLMGVGLTPDLFPATFALARHAGWTAHAIEQGANNRLIRPDVRYIGPVERSLPG